MQFQLICSDDIRLKHQKNFDNDEEAKHRQKEPEQVDAIVIQDKGKLLKVKSVE